MSRGLRGITSPPPAEPRGWLVHSRGSLFPDVCCYSTCSCLIAWKITPSTAPGDGLSMHPVGDGLTRSPSFPVSLNRDPSVLLLFFQTYIYNLRNINCGGGAVVLPV